MLQETFKESVKAVGTLQLTSKRTKSLRSVCVEQMVSADNNS